MFLDLQDQVESEMGRGFDYFQPIQYKKQVVNGINYEVIYDIGGGKFLQVNYYKDLNDAISFYGFYYVEDPQIQYEEDLELTIEYNEAEITGGWSNDYIKVNDTYTIQKFRAIQDTVEWEMQEEYAYFLPIYFKQQVVAGYNYEVIYDIGNDEYLQVNYFEDLDGNIFFS